MPPQGRALGARAGAFYDRIGAECEAVGLPFRPPDRLPNTRRVLETAESVRIYQPEVFETLHRSLFAAHFAEGRDIGDPEEIDALVAAAGADAEAARAAVDDGTMARVVTVSMQKAHEAGVTGTPAWLIGDFVVPGVQPRQFYERVIRSARARE